MPHLPVAEEELMSSAAALWMPCCAVTRLTKCAVSRAAITVLAARDSICSPAASKLESWAGGNAHSQGDEDGELDELHDAEAGGRGCEVTKRAKKSRRVFNRVLEHEKVMVTSA